jgi:hypothetical protein
MKSFFTVWYLGLLVFSAGLGAQHAHTADGKRAGAAEALPATGEYSFRIHTRNPRCQQYFNAAIAMIYGFNHDEAQRLFARAAELEEFDVPLRASTPAVQHSSRVQS